MQHVKLLIGILCDQDGAHTGGYDQCERYQSEQLPRGSHGQDHLRQRWQGKGDPKISRYIIILLAAARSVL